MIIISSYAISGVCLSVCQSVCVQDYCKSNQSILLKLVCDLTIRQPGFDLPRQQWSLLNHFRTEQRHARTRDTAMPAEANGALQTLICVLVVRSRWCLTLSNPVPWQNWMAAYLGYTLQMKTLFRGWPVMVHDTHTRRRRLKLGGTSQKNWLTFGGDVVLDMYSRSRFTSITIEE